MKQLFIATFLLNIFLIASAQKSMEISCAKEIKKNSKGKTYHKFNGTIIVSTDTINYNNNVIILNISDKALTPIFTRGLISPELIAYSDMTSTKVNVNYRSIKDTLYVTDITEVLLPNQEPILRTYRFSTWRKGFDNPSLYLFELKNETFNPTTTKSFLEGAKVSSFGFCSILI